MYTYQKKNNEGLLNITISKEEFEKAVNNAYEKSKGKYKVQGFRNGKAPRRVIEQTYGDTIFFDDAFNDVISEEYSKFLDEHQEVNPAGYPHVEDSKFTADKGLEAVLHFDLVPEVKLGSLKGLKAKLQKAEVSKEQIENELKNLQNANSRFVDSNEPAQNGDFATIDFVGSVDGVKFDGGSANDYKLELGSHTFIDGFEEQVVGMKVGDKKDVKVTFPKEYHAENLKGKPAVFEVTLKKVEKKQLPEITDKFISDVTEFETIEDYKKDVEKRLLADAERNAKLNYESALIEEVAEKSTVDIPQSMIKNEVHEIVHDFEHRLSHQGMKFEDYLAYVGQTREEFEKSREKDAEKNIKTRLVLQKIIADNKLTVTSADIDNKIEEYAKNIDIKLEDVKKSLQQQDYIYFQNQAMMEKILSFIKSQNN